MLVAPLPWPAGGGAVRPGSAPRPLGSQREPRAEFVDPADPRAPPDSARLPSKRRHQPVMNCVHSARRVAPDIAVVLPVRCRAHGNGSACASASVASVVAVTPVQRSRRTAFRGRIPPASPQAQARTNERAPHASRTALPPRLRLTGHRFRFPIRVAQAGSGNAGRCAGGPDERPSQRSGVCACRLPNQRPAQSAALRAVGLSEVERPRRALAGRASWRSAPTQARPWGSCMRARGEADLRPFGEPTSPREPVSPAFRVPEGALRRPSERVRRRRPLRGPRVGGMALQAGRRYSGATSSRRRRRPRGPETARPCRTRKDWPGPSARSAMGGPARVIRG